MALGLEWHASADNTELPVVQCSLRLQLRIIGRTRLAHDYASKFAQPIVEQQSEKKNIQQQANKE